MATDPTHILQRNHELLADICHRRMAIDSLLMSYSTIEEKRAEYQRDFNNYKHYEIWWLNHQKILMKRFMVFI